MIRWNVANKISLADYSPYLQAFTMDKHLGDHWRLHINIFNLLWCDVLSLGKLENVLFAVNQLQVSLVRPLADVPGVYPTI